MAGISVAISGGGHRAAVFGLGALIYLADAGKNREVTSISSVSGGSLTNGHLAQTLDYSDATSEQVAAWAAVPASRFTRKGTLWAGPFTWLYLLFLLLLLGAVVVGIWLLPISIWVRIPLFVAGLLIVGLVAQLRGEV